MDTPHAAGRQLDGARVLVTGADGFIGSHLVERLLAEGAKVRALCCYNSNGSRGWLDDLEYGASDGLETVLGDVRDAGMMYSLVAGVDVVCGQSPYAASKIAADQLCEAYARSYATPVVNLRPFNTYGPDQSARAVVSTILRQLLAGSTQVRIGSLHPRRDFTYVTDTVDGFVRIGQADLEPGTLVQLGAGRSVSIGDLLALCMVITDAGIVPVTDPERVRPERSEVQVLMSDPSRAAELLGWKPTVRLQNGLSETARWLRGRGDPLVAARCER